jgi:hypothetical protein
MTLRRWDYDRASEEIRDTPTRRILFERREATTAESYLAAAAPDLIDVMQRALRTLTQEDVCAQARHELREVIDHAMRLRENR